MLPQNHTRCQHPTRRKAPAGWAAALLLVLLGPALSAQDMPPPDRAIAAHEAVRAWVTAWTVPQTGDGAEELPAVWGATVTLRLDGRVLARGSAYTLDAPDPDAVRRAATAAIREARAKVQVDNDALAEENLAQIAARVTVSLELYDRSVPIPNAELALPLAGSSPGAEALVVSLRHEAAGEAAQTTERVLVSGTDAQLTRGVDPARELAAMASELTGDGATALRPIGELLELGFRFARAPTLHLAMPYENAAPVFLDRGARRIGSEEVRTPSLRRMADGVAGHLRGRVWPGIERYGLSGDLQAVTGTASPVIAPPFEQALVATALLRHAQISTGTDTGRASGEAALSILRDLALVEPGEESPWDRPTAAAMCVAALARLDPDTRESDSEIQALQARVLDVLGQSFDTERGFTDTIPGAAKGLVAWALVRAGTLDPAFTRDRADAAVRATFRDTPQGQLVAQMPFLVWAELELHPEGPVPSGAVLAQARDVVWDHQVRPGDLRSIDRDLSGGIVFTRGRSVLPTWQSMRPLAALATMMGDERLTPGSPTSGEVPGELLRVTEGLRFVRQLAMTGEGMYLARRHDQAMWGLRPALWEPRLSLEAGAMALLTTCETLDSLRKIAARETLSGEPAQP